MLKNTKLLISMRRRNVDAAERTFTTPILLARLGAAAGFLPPAPEPGVPDLPPLPRISFAKASCFLL